MSEKINTQYCSSCPYSKCEESACQKDTNNWFCDKAAHKAISYFVSKSSMVSKPHWCPLDLIGKPKSQTMSYVDRVQLWRKIPAITPWEEIKEGEVYHIPPHMDEKRKDILIVKRYDTFIHYKELGGSSNILYCLYPSTLASKFLVKNKIVIRKAT